MRRLWRVLVSFTAVPLLAGSAGAAEWRVPADFGTIQEAIDSASVKDGDAIVVEAGPRAGATVTKAVAIRADGRVRIVDGPVVSTFGKAGFFFPGGGQGSGATITGFLFTGIPLPVFSRGADDVTVNGNTMSSFLQGVTNWGYGSWGNRWEIVENTMSGLTTSCGGYNAPGIVLYADFRYGGTGAVIRANAVTKNRILVKSATPVLGGDPWLVTVSGIELSDTRNDGEQPAVIAENVVSYNDLRLMEVPFSSNPYELTTANTIENNYTGTPQWMPDPLPDRLRLDEGSATLAPSPIR